MKKAISMSVIALVISACSSSPEDAHYEGMQEIEKAQVEARVKRMDEQIDAIPGWYLEVPKPDATGVYGVGFGESNKAPFSIKAAELQAKFDLAKSFGQLMSGQERSFESQGISNQLDSQIDILIDSLVEEVNMAGFERVETALVNIDGMANAYILLKMPYEQFNDALLSMKAKSFDKRMATAFNELEQRLIRRKAEALQESNIAHQQAVELKKMEIEEQRVDYEGKALLEQSKHQNPAEQ